jgi:hypothetical protein
MSRYKIYSSAIKRYPIPLRSKWVVGFREPLRVSSATDACKRANTQYGQHLWAPDVCEAALMGERAPMIGGEVREQLVFRAATFELSSSRS